MAGFDNLQRDLLMIYDISEFATMTAKLFTKQISDFHIGKMRYVDNKNPNLLVSCGKGNICFW